MISLPSVLGSAAARKQMHVCSDLAAPNWTFWERKTLNLHRVIGLTRIDHGVTDARAFDAELRQAFARNFKRAWWRGIAYGVVAEIGSLTLTPDDLEILVDAYENDQGTMQWVILLPRGTSQATGVHTWIEGFLSPVYRDVLEALSKQGYQITSAKKEKTGLLKFLTAVADARTGAITGRKAFPDFADPFAAQAAAGLKNGDSEQEP